MIFQKNNKKIIFLKIGIYILLFSPKELYSFISVVYNLRIAESTRKPPFEKNDRPFLFGILGFDTDRQRRNNIHQNAGGILTTFSYVTPSFFTRADFAFGKVQESVKDLYNIRTLFSRTQTDDLLLSGGYSMFIRKRAKMSISGLFGLPTHKNLSVEGIQFGIGHIGLGIQVDGAVLYSPPKKHTLRMAVRYIYFVPRKSKNCINSIPQLFNINAGNIIDIFLAHNFNLGKHTFEYGYDQTFIVGLKIDPQPTAGQLQTVIRSSFYSLYRYRFSIKKTPSSISTALSYAIDAKPKKIGYKRILTAWFSWGVSF